MSLVLITGCTEFREQPLVHDGGLDAPDVPDVAVVDARVDVSVDGSSDVPVGPTDVTVDTGPCGGGCPAGRTCCGDRCVDLLTDAQNCGGCSAVCVAANASTTCQMGRCVPVCLPGFGDCDGSPLNGCEVDLAVSAFNCSACSAECSTTNANSVCDTGRCRLTCAEGWGNCDGLATNGCETNLRSTLAHCGGCNIPCPAPNHNSVECFNGMCRLGTCARGYDDCNGRASDGCEIDLNDDPEHCGRCGNACPGGPRAICVAGVCGLTGCPAGRAECDGNTATVCETDVTTSAQHCGVCGNACSTANATSVCEMSVCRLACAAGFGDCDGVVGNGCETDTRVTASHCGRCGNVCSLPRASVSACVGGSCVVGACSGTFGDCDGMAANGCETDTAASTTHCGGCGRPCVLPHATPACVTGRCAVGRCDTNYDNCDGNATNGCESLLIGDVNNCGRCGQRCMLPNAVPLCIGSACRVGGCNPGWQDCDGNPANGCEVLIVADSNNCGRCGMVCPSFARRCLSGGCAP